MQINRIELFSTHASQSTGEFYNYELLMCETSLSSLTTSFDANYSGNTPTAVLQRDTLKIDWQATSPGWNGFDLDTPFQYSGAQNLIIEFRYLGDNGKTVNARAAAISPQDRCLSGSHPQSATGTFMSFLTCMRIHYTAEELANTTFAEVKTLFRND